MYEITSDVGICNLALSRCGVSAQIESITEASQQAQTCNLYYAFVRDRLLSLHNWQFARKYVTLQDLGTPPLNWLYRYAYPAGCMRLWRIVLEGDRQPDKSERIPFQIGVSEIEATKVIYCDQEAAVAEYTTRLTDIALFPAIVIDALAWALAAEICIPLTADASRFKLAKAMADESRQTAMSVTGGEQEETPQAESDFITARL